MDTGADIEQIQARVLRALDVRRHAVADGDDTGQVNRSARGLRLAQGGAIDRDIGFAGDARLATQLFVKLGNRTGAGDQPVTTLDDEVRVGADERDLALGKARQGRAVMLGRFGLVVIEAGADDRLGIFRGNDLRPQTLEQGQVALGADEEDLLRRQRSAPGSRRPK